MTCDKVGLNRCLVRICRGLKEAEKVINCDHKKKKDK